MVKLCSGLLAYHSMQKLLLDNNILNDNGAKALAGALPHMSLRELNVGFNEIGADGLATIIEAIKQCPCLRTLNVSGNVINNQVARDMANMLIQNTTLVSLYLDNTSISPVGEKYIAAGIATNRKTGLRFFKGFDLGRVLTLLGSPAHLEHMNNTDTLQYLAVMWEAHSAEVTKTDHANDISGNKLRSTTINSNSSKQSDGDNTCSASGYSSMSSVRHDSAGNFTDDNKKLLSFDNFSAVNLGHVESLNIPAASSMKSLIKPVKSYEADFSSFPFLNRLNDEKSHDNVDEALTNPSEKLNIYLSSNVNLDLCVVTGANHRQQINAVVHDGGLSELQHPQQAFSPKLVTRLSPEAFTLVVSFSLE